MRWQTAPLALVATVALAACGRIWYDPIYTGVPMDADTRDVHGDAAAGGVGGAIDGGGGATGAGGIADGGTPDVNGAAGAPCTSDTFGGNAYTFCDGPLIWSDAEADCELKGMHLVRIDSMQENDWINGTAFANVPAGSNSQPVWRWIGANDLAVPGEWRWIDGSLFWLGGSNGTVQNGLYENWSTGTPSSSGTKKYCGAMEHALAVWSDALCASLEPYVCEQ